MSRRKCPYCNEFFRPDYRNGHHQIYCSTEACRQASKAASQRRRLGKPAHRSLQFAPGECAQVDWGSFGSVRVGSTRWRLSFFVMVLCSSRMMYVHFTLSQSMEQFLWAHRQAWEFFGGVTAVLHHPLGGPAQFHPRNLDFAAHYGFKPVDCGVRKAHEKGRVESGVKLVKHNFLAGLDVPSFEALPPAALCG